MHKALLATPVVLACGTAGAIFCAVWLRMMAVQGTWNAVEFHPIVNGQVVDFKDRLGHYLKIAEVMIALASASLVFIPQIHGSDHPFVVAYILVLLGLCVVISICFMVFLTRYYEDSLYGNPYTPTKSAFVNGLGYTALGCFALAYLMLALLVSVAVASGVSPK